MKRIVLTGPTGAIGMALIKRCMKEGIEVLAISHPESERIANIPEGKGITLLKAGLEELKDLVIDERYDVFYHLAWMGTSGAGRHDMSLQLQNIKMTLDAVTLAERLGCHTFVGAGSQAEYGRSDQLLRSDTPANPENGYGIAKLCAGQMCRQICRQKGIKHIWVRILSVYGPYDGRNSMIMSAIDQLLQGKRASFTPSGQMWDYLYSEDAAKALLLLGQKGVNGKTYVLGSGQVRPLKEYIYEIKEMIDEKGHASGSIGIGDIPYGDGQVMYLGADISELQTDTGFLPAIEFKEGIARVLQYYKEDVGKWVK